MATIGNRQPIVFEDQTFLAVGGSSHSSRSHLNKPAHCIFILKAVWWGNGNICPHPQDKKNQP